MVRRVLKWIVYQWARVLRKLSQICLPRHFTTLSCNCLELEPGEELSKSTSSHIEKGDMVLKILYAVGTTFLPSGYYTHLAVAVVGIVTIYTFAQGRKTSRERILHGRTILLTVAFHFNFVISLSG
jgi:hypothetical protein